MSAEPYLRVVWTDPVSGRNGHLVIDRLVRGIAGGGTRVRRGVTAGEVAAWRARMTLKNGSFNVPSGGAAYNYAARTIGDTVERLPALSADRQITPREAAVEIATENTERLAREYGSEEARIPATAAP
jgi:hypothetical protein